MPPDPYSTLGLTRGASFDDVRRAYRRLAKANHPDRAGEDALARFLEIQDAYDRIANGLEGGPPTGRPSSRGAAGRPWDADPGRADATRRAYGSRTRRTRSATGGARPDTAADGGSPGTGDGAAGERPPRRGRSDRPPNKATLGSTSYDGADEGPFEPDWGGASWYGTTSGTYWTLNPREYADPRKHGPEYQARARRATAGRDPGPEPDGTDASGAADPSAARAAPGTANAASGAGPSQGPATHTTTSWWDATSAGSGPTSDPGSRPTGPRPAAARPAATASARAAHEPVLPAFDAARWLEPGRGGIPARVGRAVLGWAPIALGVGWIAGEVTGCGRYSATCDAAIAPLAWLSQVVVLALLLLIPRLATATTVATLVTLAAAVPGALILSATGTDAADTMAPLALGGLLLVGWVAGLVAGVTREWRAVRAGAGAAAAHDPFPGGRPDSAGSPSSPDDGTPVS